MYAAQGHIFSIYVNKDIQHNKISRLYLIHIVYIISIINLVYIVYTIYYDLNNKSCPQNIL